MYQKRTNKETKESAVSPVVGVMLMLVVTIVIAAVVTVFASGLASTQEKAPVISLDAKIANGGNYYDSYLDMNVISVSEPIKTSDLKLTTTWFNESAGAYQVTSTGQIPVFWRANKYVEYDAPWGYGTGVTGGANAGAPTNEGQEFGSYTLIGGTVMHAYPAGQSGGYIVANTTLPSTGGYLNYEYNSDYITGGYTDGMQSVLGYGWEDLKTGSTVNVKLIYLPSNTVIFDKDVRVI